MKVLLVSANTERLNMPTMPVGLAIVSAATKRAGHDVTFLDLMFERDPESALRHALSSAAPEVIGISVRNIDDQEMTGHRFLLEKVRSVVAACREASSATIVLGGAGYSIFPVETLEYLEADVGVWGDGEAVFPEILERLARGEAVAELPGVLVAGSGLPHERATTRRLDTLDALDEAMWTAVDPAQPDLWIPVQTRRGCPNDCAYCSTAKIQGRKVRTRSPEAAVADIARMSRAGFKRFYFVDNSFNIPESHALELCRLLEPLAPEVEWRCILYPHKVSGGLVDAMARAGCVEVALGFESGNAEVLRRLNKRFTPEDVRHISDMLAARGIRRIGFLMFGAPGETRDSVEESLAFAESLGLDALRTTIGIRIYPGTPLARIAVEEGVIAADDTLFTPRFYLAPGLEPWIRERVVPGFRLMRRTP